MTILTNMKLVYVGREDKEVYFVFEKIFGLTLSVIKHEVEI